MIELGKPTLFGREVRHPLLVLAAGTAPLAASLARLAVIAPAHCVLYWSGRRGLIRDGKVAVDRQSLERRHQRRKGD